MHSLLLCKTTIVIANFAIVLIHAFMGYGTELIAAIFNFDILLSQYMQYEGILFCLHNVCKRIKLTMLCFLEEILYNQ